MCMLHPYRKNKWNAALWWAEGLHPLASWGPFVWRSGPCACMGSLWVFWLPPTVQNHSVCAMDTLDDFLSHQMAVLFTLHNFLSCNHLINSYCRIGSSLAPWHNQIFSLHDILRVHIGKLFNHVFEEFTQSNRVPINECRANIVLPTGFCWQSLKAVVENQG